MAALQKVEAKIKTNVKRTKSIWGLFCGEVQKAPKAYLRNSWPGISHHRAKALHIANLILMSNMVVAQTQIPECRTRSDPSTTWRAPVQLSVKTLKWDGELGYTSARAYSRFCVVALTVSYMCDLLTLPPQMSGNRNILNLKEHYVLQFYIKVFSKIWY